MILIFVGDETKQGSEKIYTKLNFRVASAGYPDDLHRHGSDAKKLLIQLG